MGEQLRQDRRAQDPPNGLVLRELSDFLKQQLDTIERVAQISQDTHLENDKVAWYRLMMQVAADIRDQWNAAASRLAANAAIENAASKRLAADIIGVHQATIARWIKEFPDGGANVQSMLDPNDDKAVREKKIEHRLAEILTDESVDDDTQ
ncbi:MAG: hypothetical protein ACRDRT_11085 [Pseudonocardiaceae bacterium]